MSTPSLTSPQSLHRPVSQRTVMIVVGVLVAIALAVTLLALTATTKTPSASPRLVQAAPPATAAARASDAARFGTSSSASTILSSGIGHR